MLTAAVLAILATPVDPTAVHRLRGVVSLYFDLWGWTDRGALVRFAGEQRQETVPLTGVEAARFAGNTLYALRHAGGVTTVQQWTGERFRPLPALPGKDVPIALAIAGNDPVVLHARAAYRWTGGKWRAVPLATPLQRAPLRSAAVTPDGRALYLGTDRGEWGGELQRIDLASGAVASARIEGPITGIVPARRPDCVYVAAGLAHLTSTSGRVSLVCGTTVTTILERPAVARGVDGQPPTPFARHMVQGNTEPFTDLMADGLGGFFAVTPTALYHHDRDSGSGRPAARFAMPALSPSGRLRIGSFLPGMALVATDIGPTSTDDPTPLLVTLGF